jgi:hypothetical protein
MKQICAIIKQKNLATYWGFIFNTDIQSFVEHFMTQIHFGSHDYFLEFKDSRPKGVYTNVEVFPEYYEDGSVKNITFKL